MDVLPTRISQYEIRRVLGQGGMGVVYLAFDPVLQRQVALKVLRTDSDDQRERFRREARIVARLQHPNIVSIYTVGEHEGQPYIAMEYIAGEPLSEAIRRRAPWGLQRKLLMGAELCAGLASAHRAGVIHRDVKPSNLIVSHGSGTIRLLDFGIARGVDAAASMGLTMQGNIVGTLNYMSPEQITGRPVDHRSDIFAVGVVLYELLTYRKAFPGDNLATLTYRIVHGTPEPLRTLQPDADEELCAVIERAMAREPDDRYPHLDALRTDLLRIAGRLTSSAAAAMAPDESAEPAPPAPAAIWSRILEATVESDGPNTPHPAVPAPTAPMPGVETAPPASGWGWRYWPVALAAGGIALGGATAIWLTTQPSPRPPIVRPTDSDRDEGRTPSDENRYAGGTDATSDAERAPGAPVVPPASPPAPAATPPPAARSPEASAAGRPSAARPVPPTSSVPPDADRTPTPLATERPPALPPARDERSSSTAEAPVAPAPPPVEAAPAPTASEPRPVPPATPSDEQQVRAVLTRWAQAYSAKDAQAVDEVQPGSAAALSKAFSSLRSVDVQLTACRVEVQDARATAACTERIRTEGVVAGGSLDSSRGRQFVLQKVDGRWRITSTKFGG